jgi:hypothetical protein
MDLAANFYASAKSWRTNFSSSTGNSTNRSINTRQFVIAHKSHALELAMEKKHAAQLEFKNKDMACRLQELELLFITNDTGSIPPKGPPAPPARRLICIAATGPSHSSIDNSDNSSSSGDPDVQVIIPHIEKKKPSQLTHRVPSKIRLHVPKSGARGGHPLWGLLMVRSSPPNASGIGGRGRIATIGDINCWNQFNKNYQNNTTILPTSNTTSTLTNMGILNGTRSAAAARPPKNNNHTFKTEIAQTTHDGTNVLAIGTSNTCSNTPSSLQINRTLGNSPKVRRGTTNSRASNFSNTVSMNSEDTRPRHNGSPPPSRPRQLHGSKRSCWSESEAVRCFNTQS